MDHIYPEAQGGSSELSNLAFCCENCNGGKADKTHAVDHVTGEVCALFHPRKQSWEDHFDWTTGEVHVIGLTPVGRATLEALQLNNQAVVNMRLLLRMIGEHPPKATT